MAQIKIKNIDKVLDALNDEFQSSAQKRKLLNEMGKVTVDRIKFNARTGKSLEDTDTPKPLPALKESSRRIRQDIAKKYPDLTDPKFFKPGRKRSNVTLTGQLLEALRYVIKQDRRGASIGISFKEPRQFNAEIDERPTSNSQVYTDLQMRGFGFIGIDRRGILLLKKLILDEFRRNIKKRFK